MKKNYGNDDFYSNYYFSVKAIMRVFMSMLFNVIIFLV